MANEITVWYRHPRDPKDPACALPCKAGYMDLIAKLGGAAKGSRAHLFSARAQM